MIEEKFEKQINACLNQEIEENQTRSVRKSDADIGRKTVTSALTFRGKSGRGCALGPTQWMQLHWVVNQRLLLIANSLFDEHFND